MSKLDKEVVNNFAGKIARVMKDLSSSHVYFIIQQAFGEIDWNEAEKILNDIIRRTPNIKLKNR